MRNTCKVNVLSLVVDKRGPFLLWQAMAMCLEESPPREQLRITPISLLDSPSSNSLKRKLPGKKEGNVSESRRRRNGFFVSFVIAIKNEMWSTERASASVPSPLLDSVDFTHWWRDS